MSPSGFLGEFEQMVLLAVLQCESGSFALEVRREIERSAQRSVSRGGFYTTLDRLEGKGYLSWDESEAPDRPHVGPLRRYRVTPSGLDALRTSTSAMRRLARGLDDLLTEEV